MTPELIKRHAAALPRYTSYPTANHFAPAVSAATYKGWLQALPQGASLSLYLHVPFCKELCWYCGCSTKAVRRYEPVANYLSTLAAEIDAVAALVPEQHRVTHIHWGGGSPDILTPADIVRIGDLLRRKFIIAPDAEIAVEVDPRLMTDAQAQAFAKIGINRVSIGVQDFDDKVQRAIGRIQDYRTTENVVAMFRKHGVTSVNIDLVYGLPHQTVASVTRTLEEVLDLKPDRIAIFGYAHLPQRLKHQRLIDGDALPGPVERFEQSRALAQMLIGRGYAQLGLDHFALKDDTLSTKSLQRNFQGYTTDTADALIGFGASAISRLPQGFAQNAVPADEYARRIAEQGLATARGHAFSNDDRLRAYVIERLMCDFAFAWSDLEDRFGASAERIRADAAGVVANDADHLVASDEEAFRLTERGRVLVRNVCAAFDTYLAADAARRRHALSV